ncbi:thr operon leader peptide, partial [Salmonella enterica]|nr:thr operon leader peptide [Salmonella enterica]
ISTTTITTITITTGNGAG